LAEQADENAERQNDPGDVPENDLIGHRSSLRRALIVVGG
jgi:hypothetical protein